MSNKYHFLLVVGFLLGAVARAAGGEQQQSFLRDSHNKLPTHTSRRQLQKVNGTWPVGTKVYYNFVDDGGWYEGEITDWDDDGYTIEWSDQSLDVDDFSDEEIDQMVEDYQTMVANGTPAPTPDAAATPDDTWPVGTQVYMQFDDVWYTGKITDWDDDGYSITWDEDGSVDYDDFTDEQVDQAVEDYKTMFENDTWPATTRVYMQFDEVWYKGTITDWDDDGYSITWDEDGSVDYDDFTDEEIDQAVEDYQTMFVEDTWPVNTRVYMQIDEVWYKGTITDWDDDGYTVTWDEDGSVDYDDFPDEEIDQAVEDYQTMFVDGTWPVNTRVYMQFDGTWYTGTITDWDDDGYTITWDDGSVDYDDFTDEQVEQAVNDYLTMGANAAGSNSGDGGKSGLAPGAVFAIVAVVIIFVVGAVCCFVRRRKFRQEEITELNPSDANGTAEIM